MTEIRVQGDQITIGNATHVFDFEIDDFVIVDGTVVVLLSIPVDEIYNRNVFGFGTDGTRHWQIQAFHSECQDSPCLFIDEREGDLITETWMGIRAIVDPETGEIIETKFTK